jgi:hypothetical protein
LSREELAVLDASHVTTAVACWLVVLHGD